MMEGVLKSEISFSSKNGLTEIDISQRNNYEVFKSQPLRLPIQKRQCILCQQYFGTGITEHIHFKDVAKARLKLLKKMNISIQNNLMAELTIFHKEIKDSHLSSGPVCCFCMQFLPILNTQQTSTHQIEQRRKLLGNLQNVNQSAKNLKFIIQHPFQSIWKSRDSRLNEKMHRELSAEQSPNDIKRILQLLPSSQILPYASSVSHGVTHSAGHSTLRIDPNDNRFHENIFHDMRHKERILSTAILDSNRQKSKEHLKKIRMQKQKQLNHMIFQIEGKKSMVDEQVKKNQKKSSIKLKKNKIVSKSFGRQTRQELKLFP